MRSKTLADVRYWDFDGLDGWRYQAVETVNGNLRLWYLMPGETRWEIGHTKLVNGRMGLGAAAELMRRYVLGELSYDEYNGWLP
jgi:hypothetical protein